MFQGFARERGGAPDAGAATGSVAAEIGNGQTGFACQGIAEGQRCRLSAAHEIDGFLILFTGTQGDALRPRGGHQSAGGVLRRCLLTGGSLWRAETGQTRRQHLDTGGARVPFLIKNAAEIALRAATVFLQQRRQQTCRAVQGGRNGKQHTRRAGVQGKGGHTLSQRRQPIAWAAGKRLQRDEAAAGGLQSGRRRRSHPVKLFGRRAPAGCLQYQRSKIAFQDFRAGGGAEHGGFLSGPKTQAETRLRASRAPRPLIGGGQ